METALIESLKNVEISSKVDLFRLLNKISPSLDGWSLTDPMSANRLNKFSSKKVRAFSYIKFSIPKKSGGQREIKAPNSALKNIQSAINVLLQAIFEPSKFTTGFIMGKSIKDNAEIHIGQTCIFNLDIENFFPSITKLMVRRSLKRELGNHLSSDAINYIANICTFVDDNGREVLPQGAPTSPILSNIVLKSFDNLISVVAAKYGYRYSRYADDITFSHHKPIWKISASFELIVKKIIERQGLKINDKKTRVQVKGHRQEVTGIIVSNKINVTSKYIKNLRTLFHLWEKYGYTQAQIIYQNDFCHGSNKQLAKVIDGKINYICMVKGKDDSTYNRYKSKFKFLNYKLNHKTN